MSAALRLFVVRTDLSAAAAHGDNDTVRQLIVWQPAGLAHGDHCSRFAANATRTGGQGAWLAITSLRHPFSCKHTAAALIAHKHKHDLIQFKLQDHPIHVVSEYSHLCTA
jgi:hypothetical protein